MRGSGHRSTDDQDRRPGVDRRPRGHHPLLVANGGVSGTNAGNDEETVLPLLARRFYLVARADDPVEPGFPGESGKSLDLAMAVAVDSDRIEIVAVEAGQHGHRNHLGTGRRRSLGILEHGPST